MTARDDSAAQERADALEAALKALVDKLDECGPAIAALRDFAAIHHHDLGPGWRDELAAARAALEDGDRHD